MAQIIDGKAISAQIKAEVKEGAEALFREKGIRPGLAVLLVGDDPASEVYVSSKEKACIDLGFHSIFVRMPADASEETVIAKVMEWNSDANVHGILVQSPLPKQINEQKVLLAIKPSKDVDGFHPENVGRLVLGLPGFVSCTPAGIVELLLRYNIDMEGKHAVVVGRSNIVGKPIANLLYQKKKGLNSIVTICHTGAKDIKKYTRDADILIAALGVPHAIKADDVKDGVVIIDVGITRVPDATKKSGTRLIGDVDYDDVFEKASAITPVPGGVGLMTIAMLMKNTLLSAQGGLY